MPRAGSLAYYDYPNKTGEAGHAVFAQPNGMVWSTDILRHGHVDLVPYLAPVHVWGMRYLGWIDWTPSGAINLAPLPSKPIISRPSTSPWAKGAVYRSKLHFGQTNSDSVKRLQYQLKYKFGYKALTITGTYDVYTDTCVRAWQKRIGHKPDPIRKSFIGPIEFVKMFGAHSAYVLHS